MILKNKTKYLLMAGLPGILTTPVYSQIYMCKQCPEMTYSNGKECVPCGNFQYSDAGATSCKNLTYNVEYTVANLTDGQSSNVYLKPGYYALILGGGNGSSHDDSSGGNGAQLQYVLKVDNAASVTLKAGSHSRDENNVSGAAYLKTGNTYYVAGGGGNGGKDNDCTKGIDGGSAPSPANSFGGSGGLFGYNKKKCSGYTDTKSVEDGCARSPSGVYPGEPCNCCYGYVYKTAYWKNGGNGRTSHSSNTNKFSSMLCRACAKILKIR